MESSEQAAKVSTEQVHRLMVAVEALLADLAATKPGAAQINGAIGNDVSDVLLDNLYLCWNDCIREIHGTPELIVEPSGIPDEDLIQIVAKHAGRLETRAGFSLASEACSKLFPRKKVFDGEDKEMRVLFDLMDKTVRFAILGEQS